MYAAMGASDKRIYIVPAENKRSYKLKLPRQYRLVWSCLNPYKSDKKSIKFRSGLDLYFNYSFICTKTYSWQKTY